MSKSVRLFRVSGGTLRYMKEGKFKILPLLVITNFYFQNSHIIKGNGNVVRLQFLNFALEKVLASTEFTIFCSYIMVRF